MTIPDPHHAHDAFLAAFTDHDVDALVGLYEDGATAVNLDGTTSSGHEQIRAGMEGLVDLLQNLTGGSRKVVVVGDLALSSGNWRGTVTAADGTVQEVSGVTAEVLRRQPDGSWRVVIDDPSFV